MGETSAIEWTDATWNPVTGCTKVSPGCDHCYAEGIANRFRGPAFPNGFEVTLRPKRLAEPFRWQTPRRVFVNSMSDLFHESVPDDYIAHVFAVMALTPRHTYQVLTKRHGRMRTLLGDEDFRSQVSGYIVAYTVEDGHDDSHLCWPARPHDWWPLDNVWLGVSVENQQWADIRVPALLATPAAVRFLSCEPLLGPVSLLRLPFPKWSIRQRTDMVIDALGGKYGVPGQWQAPAAARVDWVIVGGESGAGARPMKAEWAHSLRDQCVEAGVPFFFKQWGTYNAAGHRAGKKAAGRILGGRTWDEYPATAVAS